MEIRVYNTAFELVYIIERYESLIWTDRFRGYGEFELYTEATPTLLSFLQEHYYLEIDFSDKTMIIDSISVKFKPDEGNRLLVKGRSLESILDRRINWDVIEIDDTLENGIIEILDGNITDSPFEPSTRVISNFVYVASGNSAIQAMTLERLVFYCEDIYTVILEICKSANVGYKILLNEDDEFEFQLYLGTDRSLDQILVPQLIFSPDNSNVLSSNFLRTALFDKTMAVALYDNEPLSPYGIDRYPAYSPYHDRWVAGMNRREQALDIRGTVRIQLGDTSEEIDAKLAQVLQRLKETLEEYKHIETFDAQIERAISYVYRTDYFLGDLVQFIDSFGNGGKSIITEVTYVENLSGINIYPTFENI